MIKNVLLPEKVGNYYIFNKRILGFDIGKTHVHAIQILLHGTSTTVEKVFHEILEHDATSTYQEKVGKAISAIVAQAHKKCVIHSALSSSVVVFKTLKLPFLDREKIAMVVGYEIEPLLPFALADAMVDFIITKQSSAEKSSEILVAATQKSYVVQHMEYFLPAKVSPDKISIDMFDLYALYRRIPSYTEKKGGVALIDLGFNATRIGYLFDGQLRMVRSLPKGISRIVKSLSERINLQSSDVFDKLMRFGLETSDNLPYNEALQDVMSSFWSEIQFTVSSFATKESGPLESLILCGGGALIKDMEKFASHYMGTSCELFSLQGLSATSGFYVKNQATLSMPYAQSLATALPSPLIDGINLRQKELAVSDYRTFVQQFILVSSLFCMLFGILIVHYLWQTRALSHELHASQEDVIESIKKQFNVPKDVTEFDDIIEFAKNQVKKDETMWFAFSGQSRSSFLKYLLALHTLDKDGLGLDVEHITIREGTLELKAKVKDYDALKKLEKELRKSKLFSYIEPQEKTDFTMRITLVKNNEE